MRREFDLAGFHAVNTLLSVPRRLLERSSGSPVCRITLDPAPHPPTLYLTFDDGPTPGHTEQLLELLEGYDAAATFFVTTAHLDNATNHSLVQHIQRKGHAVGSHGDEHADPWLRRPDDVCEDLRRSVARLQALGLRPGWFRPPYGHIRPSMFAVAHSLGLRVVLWDVMPGDFRKAATAARVFESARRDIRAGSIIVLHDNEHVRARGATLGAVEKLLDHYSSTGWRFASLPTS